MIEKSLAQFKQKIGEVIGQTQDDFVRFASPKNKADHLEGYGIFIVLFSNKPRPDLQGRPQFEAMPKMAEETQRPGGLLTRPPLRMSMEVLVIFGVQEFKNALKYYEQVTSYFYQYQVFEVSQNAAVHRVEVLLESPEDQKALEVRQTLNIPTTPFLIYTLQFLLIPGAVELSSAIDEFGIDGKTKPIGTQGHAFLADQTQRFIESIRTALHELIQFIERSQGNLAYPALEEHYERVKKAYEVTQVRLEKIKPPFLKKAFDQLNKLLKRHEVLLASQWKSLKGLESEQKIEKTKCLALSAAASKMRKGDSEAERQQALDTRLKKLLQNIIKALQSEELLALPILQSIDSFNELGSSLYLKQGSDFSQHPDLSEQQLELKRWQLENRLRQVYQAYTQILNLDENVLAEESYRITAEKIQGLLTSPIEELSLLNKSHLFKEQDKAAQQTKPDTAYLKAYKKAYTAVNGRLVDLQPRAEIPVVRQLYADLEEYIEQRINS